jgi:signal transduction histidine kinase
VLDHARREFVANASHELRTPLFSLGGFLELMEDEVLDEATRKEFMETMSEQVRRLTKLADDLLDLSRLDAGRLRVSPEPIDLSELASAVVDEFTAVARSGGHPLEVDRDGAVPAVGDGERVIQIARILVENALLHTPKGTTVRVRARQEDGRALLEVEDEGPGIPAEHAPHLFERFYRVDGTKASGSGLGLAIAKELAEVMGGTIDVESDEGRTTFTLTLAQTSN